MLMCSARRGNLLAILVAVAAISATALAQADSPDADRVQLTGEDLLVASTFVGGSGRDGRLEAPVAVDADGNVFVAGRTSSLDIPYSEEAFDTTYGGGDNDVIVAKLTSDLSSLLACTYVGGSGDDGDWPGVDLAVDPNGDVYVVTKTNSAELPTSPAAIDPTLSGPSDGYIIKLSNDLSQMLAATYIGGAGNEYFFKLAVDGDSAVYITGTTSSYDFPTTSGAVDNTYNGFGLGTLGGDVFIARLGANLDTILAATYFGGQGADFGEATILDADRNIYFAGWTQAAYPTGYPTSPGCYQATYGGGSYDGFVTKLSGDLTTVMGSTYLGGNQWDFAYGMTIADDGRVIVTGHTASANFDTSPGALQSSYQGAGGEGVGDDAFVTVLNSDLTDRIVATYLGSPGWENGTALVVDPEGGIIVLGNTRSDLFVTSPEAFDTLHAGDEEGFVTRLNDSLTTVLYSSFLGGEIKEIVGAALIDADGFLLISGSTNSPLFPVVPGSYDLSYNGSPAWTGDEYGGDIYISRMAPGFYYDSDGDGLADAVDNCPDDSNSDQADSDSDGVGDSCDQCPGFDDGADADQDGIPDDCDACTDTDGDGFGNPDYAATACAIDNCPESYNPGQEDENGDGLGDACCCLELTGNVNGDPDDIADIGDLTVLIGYLFIPPYEVPACMTEANIDGEGPVDIGDLTSLIGYLFIPPYVEPGECL